MKPAPFTYHDPATVADVTALLGRLENTRVLAGGQSLMPLMNFRYVTPDHLIDLNGVAELAYLRPDGNTLAVGAMTRQRDLEFSADVRERCPIILEALSNVGHRQTRNRGTIGGSLCHLDPSAELANMALLHDASIDIRGGHGTRTVPMSDFALGFMTPDLRDGEFLAGLTLCCWPKGHGYAFAEVARRRGDFAVAAAAALLDIDANGTIRRAALCLSGVGPVPVRVTQAESELTGSRPSHDVFRAASLVSAEIEAMEDAHVSAAYRQHLARVLTYRVLERAAQRAGVVGHG